MELTRFLCMTLFIALPNLSYSKQNPLQSRIDALENVAHRMEGVINEQSKQITDQSEQLRAFKEEITALNEKITILGEENKNQSRQITNLNFDHNADDAFTDEVSFIPGTYIKGVSGCLSDTITLSCPVGQTILMDKAEYGEFTRGCASTCCTPHPYDCKELMETSNPNEWLTLQLACDNQESCSYLFQGSTFVGECTIANAVDYVHLFYTCLPVSSTEPIGFTAYSVRYVDEYYIDDVLKFEGVITNLGDYYNAEFGIFICPVHGVYIFGADILSAYSSLISAQLMVDTEKTTTAYADDISDTSLQASTTIVVQCHPGQQIWLRSHYDNAILHGNSDFKHSSFYGYLLYRL